MTVNNATAQIQYEDSYFSNMVEELFNPFGNEVFQVETMDKDGNYTGEIIEVKKTVWSKLFNIGLWCTVVCPLVGYLIKWDHRGFINKNVDRITDKEDFISLFKESDNVDFLLKTIPDLVELGWVQDCLDACKDEKLKITLYDKLVTTRLKDLGQKNIDNIEHLFFQLVRKKEQETNSEALDIIKQKIADIGDERFKTFCNRLTYPNAEPHKTGKDDFDLFSDDSKLVAYLQEAFLPAQPNNVTKNLKRAAEEINNEAILSTCLLGFFELSQENPDVMILILDVAQDKIKDKKRLASYLLKCMNFSKDHPNIQNRLSIIAKNQLSPDNLTTWAAKRDELLEDNPKTESWFSQVFQQNSKFLPTSKKQ